MSFKKWVCKLDNLFYNFKITNKNFLDLTGKNIKGIKKYMANSFKIK